MRSGRCPRPCTAVVVLVRGSHEDDELTILQADVPAELAGQVRDAVSRCPKMALSIED